MHSGGRWDGAGRKGGKLENQQLQAGLSLIFGAGQRPTVQVVEDLLGESDLIPMSASISHKGEEGEGWVELLASGLTFDLVGLAPAASAPVLPAVHRYGIDADFSQVPSEAIALVPGQHIAGGHAMMPVVKAMASLVAGLALQISARAVCWHPARTWMDPNYFARIVLGWQSGGAFPALGLTAISVRDGRAVSSGLAYFVGQEIEVEAREGEPTADTVKLAVRVIDYIVRNGALTAPRQLEGPNGEVLLAEPSQFGKMVWVWRGT